MLLKKLPHDFTICKARSLEDIDLNADFYFLVRTDEELSLVCRTEDPSKNHPLKLVLESLKWCRNSSSSVDKFSR